MHQMHKLKCWKYSCERLRLELHKGGFLESEQENAAIMQFLESFLFYALHIILYIKYAYHKLIQTYYSVL